MPQNVDKEQISALVKALEAGNYDAAPSKLRQGSIFALKEVDSKMVALTEEEEQEMWRQIELTRDKG
jgi:hypothetical protein